MQDGLYPENMVGDEDVQALIDGTLRTPDGDSTRVLAVSGAPRAGKTEFALRSLLKGMQSFGESGAVMTVSNRVIADRLNGRVIHDMSVLSQARPITTLSAVAFRIISAVRAHDGKQPAKLLNGAEQDALLRDVLAVHIAHAIAGDLCDVCQLLQRYFMRERLWANVLTSMDVVRQEPAGGMPENGGAAIKISRGGTPAGDSSVDSATTFARHINDAFIAQLRDMLSRMNELGLTYDDESRVMQLLVKQSVEPIARERLETQWRLSFALWREYADHIATAYPNEYRLDNARLFVEARESLCSKTGQALPGIVPQLLVIDDWQDTTLAAAAMVQELHDRGCRLLLVGNNDEAVQVFRGSYPEFLDVRVAGSAAAHNDHESDSDAAAALIPAELGRFHAKRCELPPVLLTNRADGEGPTMLDTVASRISLSILSSQEGMGAVPDRPGKMPQYPGAFPVMPLEESDACLHDGTVQVRIMRSSDDEINDIVWQIKKTHLIDSRDFNEMVVIAHDNATVQAIGRALRESDVPVRFTSVSRPLKDEPAVQGVFALAQLADARNTVANSDDGDGDSWNDPTLWAASMMRRLLSSPLMDAKTRSGGTRPVHMQRLDSIVDTLTSLMDLHDLAVDADTSAESLADAAVSEPSSEVPERLRAIADAWRRLADSFQTQHNDDSAESDGVVVDDSLLEVPQRDWSVFDDLSVWALLVFADDTDQRIVLDAMRAIAVGNGTSNDLDALERCVHAVDTTAEGIHRLQSASDWHDENNPAQYILWEAWQACNVEHDWQQTALSVGPDGETANNRLDALMRLFQFAQVFAGDIRDLVVQVQNMQVEADSLAHVGPIEHAVTIATPAGVAGQTWPLVWLPALQEGTWPNLKERDTLFGAEDLADLAMYGRLKNGAQDGADARLKQTLYAEKKSFFVALTRANECVTLSAVHNDDASPSDFLYGLIPEMAPRVAEITDVRYTSVGDGSRGGLDADKRGLVSAARSILASACAMRHTDNHADNHADITEETQSAAQFDNETDIEDAIRALRLLQREGVEAADPQYWTFLSSESSSERLNADHAGRADHAECVERAEYDTAGDAAAERSTNTAAPSAAQQRPLTVFLSPSQVDNLWKCPLRWTLENRYGGPRAGSVHASFGTQIHKMAELASLEGLDRPDHDEYGVNVFATDEEGMAQRIDAIADRMLDLYQENTPVERSPREADAAYQQRQITGRTSTIAHHIATYFVKSMTAEYAQKSEKAPIPVGLLVDAQCEVEFSARFTCDDIRYLWNNTFPESQMDTNTLFSLMATLTGGMPQGADPKMTIVLSGRIDRLEHRRMQDGRIVTRLLDYKTGKNHHSGKAVFSDLQLVCYQLAQQFAEAALHSDAERKARFSSAPKVSQAVLYDVFAKEYPAESHSEETVFQPALFDGCTLNNVYLPRLYASKMSVLYDYPDLPEQAPDGIDSGLWHDIVQLRYEPAMWALDMLSRVVFAAGARRSAAQRAKRDASTCRYCPFKRVCPAWPDNSITIMEATR